jgi:hypothetical protein
MEEQWGAANRADMERQPCASYVVTPQHPLRPGADPASAGFECVRGQK